MVRLSLRQKLLLVSSLILLIPWLGIRYVQAIEDYLQHVILDNLTAYTQTIATNLETRAELIPVFPPGESIYAETLRNMPVLDGYNSDWGGHSGLTIALKNDTVSQGSPQLMVARFDETMYFFIEVTDSEIQYYQPDLWQDDLSRTDALEIEITIGQTLKKLLLITEAPGEIYARDSVTLERSPRIQGVWREQDQGNGYQIEFKIPESYVSAGVRLSVTNVSLSDRTVYSVSDERLMVLSTPDTLRDLLNQYGLVDGRRLRLVDTEGRMLASVGSLLVGGELTPVNPLFAWLLTPDAIADPWDGQTTIARQDVLSASRGEPMSQRTALDDRSSIMLSSAWPIYHQGHVRAVVLIEESTAALQVLQRSALASMLNVSLIIFLLLTLVLIGFAGRLSARIRRLEKITDEAIDKQGRVQTSLPEIKHGDELDELNNHIRSMLIRLRAYHDYLEKLASRLAHEIRTPLAIVRSSLENLQSETESNTNSLQQDSLERANQGVMRLQTLLHRMAEASRLEQSIHETVMEPVELSRFLAQLVSGYGDIYPQHRFECQCTVENIQASPDLLAQALDKLISNAVSFADEGSVITVHADRHESMCRLSVSNRGPLLPEGMESQLFQSMVSVRDTNHHDGQPHLGLGLHIVQLIAEFHNGYARAINLKDGVCISLYLDGGQNKG